MIANQEVIYEMFIPKQRISTTDVNKLVEYQRLYSGKKDLYLSVYHYRNTVSTATAIVDRIFLDFDYDEDMFFFDDVRTVAKFLYDSDYTFCVRFSGRGFHIFISLEESDYNNGSSIKKWVQYMHQKTNTKSDRAVVGDLRRVSRMLGSMNLKTHLFCIPITYNQLMNMSYDDICLMARRFHATDEYNGLFNDSYHYGNNNIDLSKFYVKTQPSKSIKTNIDINNIKVQQSLPHCIENMLKNPELGYHERGMLILYLRDDGYSFDEILAILKKVLSDEKYYHCTVEEEQPAYLYFTREDLLFASCQTLKDNGLCGSDSCRGNHLYL